MYTDHSQNMHITTNTACTKSSNMRHSFNTLQTTVACDTADMCSAASNIHVHVFAALALCQLCAWCAHHPVNCQILSFLSVCFLGKLHVSLNFVYCVQCVRNLHGQNVTNYTFASLSCVCAVSVTQLVASGNSVQSTHTTLLQC